MNAADSGTVSASRVVVGVGIPLLVATAAFDLWWLSDQLLYVGPLDRATFGWVVVVPVWLATPLASAVAWRGLDSRARTVAATALGLIIGGAAALLLWQAVAQPACQYGAIRGPEAWIGQALILGAAIGGGLTIGSIVASDRLATGRTVAAIVGGVGTQVAVMVIAILVFTSFALSTPPCHRP